MGFLYLVPVCRLKPEFFGLELNAILIILHKLGSMMTGLQNKFLYALIKPVFRQKRAEYVLEKSRTNPVAITTPNISSFLFFNLNSPVHPDRAARGNICYQ